MKLFAGLVSHDENLCEYFTNLKSKAFPSDAFDRSVYKNVHVEVSTLGIPSSFGDDEIARSLLSASRHSDYFLLLIERSCAGMVVGVKSAPLVSQFDITVGSSPRNLINSLTGRSLRSLAVIIACKDEELMRLPLRNFVASDLRRLADWCHQHAVVQDFAENFERLMKKVRGRVRPRRHSLYPARYAVDDDEKLFVYGKERHARPDTGAPHNACCEIQATFRFGRRVDRERHFNVSTGERDVTSIKGRFPNCHDEDQLVLKTTHINMFCSDFF